MAEESSDGAFGFLLLMLDRIQDIVGEKAAYALVQYAAQNAMDETLRGLTGRPRRIDAALGVAASVLRSPMHLLSEGATDFEVNLVREPAFAGRSPALAGALYQGALLGLSQAIFPGGVFRASVTGEDERHLIVAVERENP